MNKKTAIKLINVGVIASCISAIITLSLVIVAKFRLNSALLIWNDMILLLDVSFVLVCAYFIYKRSRTASFLMLAYFIISKVIIFLQVGYSHMLLLSSVFIIFFILSLYGTFIYHKMVGKNNNKDKSKIFLIYGVILSLVIIITLIISDYKKPSKYVLTGQQVSSYHRFVLEDALIIEDDDKIEYFYSIGMKSILEGGTILTSDRVISYEKQDRLLLVNSMDIKDIGLIEQGYVGNVVISSKYKLESHDGKSFFNINIGAIDRGDEKFIGLLKAKVAYEEIINEN